MILEGGKSKHKADAAAVSSTAARLMHVIRIAELGCIPFHLWSLVQQQR